MYDQIIIKLKQYIDLNETNKFKEYLTLNFEELKNTVDLGYVFQKVYLHACLRKRKDMAEWLQTECFSRLQFFEQSSIRQVFAYGNHLLKK